MQDLIISELLTLAGELFISYLVLAYLYKRKEFPRSNKLFWGLVFILIAGLMSLTVDFAIRDLGFYDSVMKIPAEAIQREKFSEVVGSIYSLIKLIIPFSFAAVGAGLISNALVNKP